MKKFIIYISAFFLILNIINHIFYQDTDFWNALYFLKEDIVLLFLFIYVDRYTDTFWESMIVKYCWIYIGMRLAFNLLVFTKALDYKASESDSITLCFYGTYLINVIIATIISLKWEKKNYS